MMTLKMRFMDGVEEIKEIRAREGCPADIMKFIPSNRDIEYWYIEKTMN